MCYQDNTDVCFRSHADESGCRQASGKGIWKLGKKRKGVRRINSLYSLISYQMGMKV